MVHKTYYIYPKIINFKGNNVKISSVQIKGFRNFKDALISFNDSSLIIGANDVGKTNMFHALRILLDKSLSELDIEPGELDFHIDENGTSENIEITIYFEGVYEDAVISILKGHVSDKNEAYFRYTASRKDLNFKIFIGHSIDDLEEVTSRFYLKYINLKYIQSQRDLEHFIKREKRHLLKIAQKALSEDEISEDEDLFEEISTDLSELNEKISQLVYVDKATSEVNEELKKLAHHHSDYSVQLDSGAIQVNDFIDRLQLGATTKGSSVMLGGDGRNNQILLALWKARSMREQDLDNEVVFYVIEEPEAHLHPHQQRKLSKYLINELPGQSFISSHSPQITANFSPDSIIRLFLKNASTIAASNGCADCISESWDNMGYRISILPGEAFFSNGVMLVEGPSEMLFYHQLSEQLKIDLDFLNLSLLSVDGVSFKVYIKILDALEIPWVMRTDNDVSKVSKKDKWQYAGMNRCLNIIGRKLLKHRDEEFHPIDTIISGEWSDVSKGLNKRGVFLSKIDLETDLVEELSSPILKALNKRRNVSAIEYLQKKKAIRMRELLKNIACELHNLEGGELAKPLYYLQSIMVK